MAAEKGFRAVAKYLRISPFKVRPIADRIRGRGYGESMALLAHLPHKGARMLRKVIKSAGDNALAQNRDLRLESLYVTTVLIDEGPRLRRIWIRGRGRADLLRKRMSHISVVLGRNSSSLGGTS